MAQDTDPSLIILMNRDLWSWSGQASDIPVQYAACQPSGEAILSLPIVAPDGRNMAFLSEPQMVRAALGRSGGIGGGALPNHIWLCGAGMGGRELTLAGTQPSEASFFVEGQQDRATIHSDPAWSPDGGHLAWTELGYPDGSERLSIYDLNSGTILTVELNVEPQYGVPRPLPIMWGDVGIIAHSTTYDPAQARGEEAFLVYDASGRLIARTPFEVPDQDFIYHRALIADSGQDYVGLLLRNRGWTLVDPLTGETRSLAGSGSAPELLNLNSPDDAALVLTVNEAFEFEWWVTYPDGIYVDDQGKSRTFLQGSLSRITPGPNGSIAVVFDGVHVWHEGDSFVVEQTEAVKNDAMAGIVWGPTGWRVRSGETQTTTEAMTCPGFMVSRLVVGESARVLPGPANNVRENPTRGAGLLFQIPGGGRFTVLAGPVCADSLAWWQVNYEGLVGWTAEGQGSSFWLEPISG